MIPFSEAYRLVLEHSRDFGTEKVPLKEANGRVLAEAIYADRDFPPFDRATKDGIAINFHGWEKGRKDFEIDGVIAAGQPAAILKNEDVCMEIMTGAIVPYDADTVVMYEHLGIDQGIAHLNNIPEKGQNIHFRGSDQTKGSQLLPRNIRITPADIGILAAVGQSEVPVRKLPRIAIISTGNELVEVEEIPRPHEIRRSNAYQLYAALKEEGIQPLMLHVSDDKDIIRQKLIYAIEEMDVLLLSGGVSKGKFDFIPQVLEELGVEKIFHRVLQRPGKPFWFGQHRYSGTLVFSFPGNPVSTFVCFYCYFKDWLKKSMELPIEEINVILEKTVPASVDLTQLLGVHSHWEHGVLRVSPIRTTGSGDLTGLAGTDGFICLHPRDENYQAGTSVPFIPVRKLL